MNDFGIKAGYTPRLTPQYFNDTLEDSGLWQADVYRLAAQLARHWGAKRLIDLGCGRAEKLLQYADEFQITGIDYGENITYLQNHPVYNKRHMWTTANLNTDVLDSLLFEDSVVICADVIEHLPDPTALMKTLRNASKVAKYVIVSTPDRMRVYKHDHDGPPGNPAHVREWTNNELQTWFKAEGFTIQWAGWTVSNDARPDQVWTSLLVLSNTHTVKDMLPQYQPAIGFQRSVRKGTGERLKVWMTPTPIEAARDPENAIHQVVLRMAKHLPDYGVDLVEQPDNADLRAGHAGQGSHAPIDVAHYHGLYNTAGGHNERHFFAINSHVIANLRSAKIITAPSEWIADVLRRDMHVSPRIIGWGVDTDEWQPVENPGLYVLWNKARVDAVSDPAPMLELAARLPNVPFLTTFGKGGHNVRTIGRQTYTEMKNYVRNASVYLATVTETFGIATLEAMAAGVPTLGFRHGNTAHLVVHGVTGFLAEPGDIAGLEEGLRYCLRYRDRLGANAREAAKAYTWEHTAEQFAAVYRDALEPHKGAKVSVVIPCHNYAQFVGQAIESALDQQVNFKYEIIVVLDRCTDDSAQVVARYANRGVIALEADNGSLSATRNNGIDRATGEFIVLLDADDKLGSPLFLQTLADALDADRTLGIAFTGIRVMDAEGNLRPDVNPWPKGYDFHRQMQRINQIPSCCLFRKEAWERAGGFRPWFKYAEDAEFWTTVLGIGYNARHVVDDGWFHYRIHNQSASQAHRSGEVKEPDWTEFHPWTKDGQVPLAAFGNPQYGSWPVRYYLKPDVTVIIPVGPGHEEAVKDALHSVEGQTHRQWECIVVNDTCEPLDLTGFPWAKAIRTTGEGGAGYARNIGAQHANAPFLVFLDADDILKPTFLEKALQVYKRNGRYAYCDWMEDDRRGGVQIHATLDYSLDAFRQHPSIHPITALIPRKWFVDVGGFDETLPAYEDVDLFMKLMVKGYCGQRIPEPLLVYNLDSGNRRKAGESFKPDFLTLLKDRYGAFMEAKAMCDCVDPPKGKSPVAPTPENVSEYRETYGEMVKVQYTSPFAPASPTTLRGPATRVYYGERAKGEIFFVWEVDLTQGGNTFTKADDYVAEPAPTITPPEPPDMPFADEYETIEHDGDVLEVVEAPATQALEKEKRTPAPRGGQKRKATRKRA